MINTTLFEDFVGQAARALGATLPFSSSGSEIVDWMDNKNPPTIEALNAKIEELSSNNSDSK